MPTDPMSGLPLETFLSRVSDHLDLLAAQVHDLEEAIGSAVLDNPNDVQVEITRLQGLDYVRQCLEDLALLTTVFENQIPESGFEFPNIDRVRSKLKLEITKGILFNEIDSAPVSEKRAVGDFDLF